MPKLMSLRPSETTSLSRLEFRPFAALFAVLFVLAAIPVLLSGVPPLFDYPNHLARMHILIALPHSATLQRFYEIVWRPLPNLAMDALVPPLARLMPLAWAGRIFILLIFFLLAGGVAVLHRVVHGSWSAWSFLAFLLLYSRMLLWGFLNYLFGIGLGLWALAAWIALRRRAPPVRLVVATALSLALFFSHLLAFGLYGVLVAGYETGLIWRRRPRLREAIGTLVIAAMPFVPALAIAFFSAHAASSGPLAFSQPLRKVDLLFSVFDNYSRPFDVACFALAGAALVLARACRWIRIEPTMAGPLVLLLLVYLAMPSRLFTASGADHRIPLLLGLVLFAGSAWVAPWRRAERLFLGGAGLLFVIRLAVVAMSWQHADRVYGGLIAALDRVPQGSTIAVSYPAEAVNSDPVPLVHLPTLAIMRRDAFVPTLFAYATQQPVAFRPPYDALAERLPPELLWSVFAAGTAPLEKEGRAALERYDYVVFLDRRPFTLATTDGLRPAFLSPRFQLFHVVRPRAGLDDAGTRR